MYAEVIVDLSAEAVDKKFSYLIPEGMNVAPGMLVTVPFGPRTLDGFVVGITDRCSLDPSRVKPVTKPARPEPVVLPELMELADWMHRRYLCNLVDALRLMIPSELRGGRVREKTRRYATLALEGDALAQFIAQNQRAKKQLEIVERLRSGPLETAGLDPAGRESILQRIMDYRRETEGTVLLISHSMDDVARLATRLLVFDRGKIVMDGTPAQVFDRAGELKAMGLTVPAATEIALALRERGIDIPESIYTINYLRKQLVSLREGGGSC